MIRASQTALFSLRSSRARFGPALQNGSMVHQVLLPDQGDVLSFNVYYDGAPRRDFGNLDLFSSGKMIATFTLPRALVHRSAGAVVYAFTLEAEELGRLRICRQSIEYQSLLDAITVHLSGTSPALSVRLRSLVVPFGATVIALKLRDGVATVNAD